MRIIDCGVAGVAVAKIVPSWDQLVGDPVWRQIVEILAPDSTPRPVQAAAIRDQHLLSSRRNLVVSAPTNAGKSLVGLLGLLGAVKRGKRAVLLEPMRAIAEEKYEQLSVLSEQLGEALGRDFTLSITTGDYRLSDDEFSDPPPDTGELIIATPERFEAILRNPLYQEWVESVGAVCVDEAHMVSDKHRGPNLEHLVTVLLTLTLPPRLIFLSATMGNIDRCVTWLEPCDAVQQTDRVPPLQKRVVVADDGEKSDAVLTQLAKDILTCPGKSLLVFVYQTARAGKLATALDDALGDGTGPEGAVAYHGKMTSADRISACRSFVSGESRCAVATTALAMGVNLPCTHVVVADPYRYGSGPLPVAELLQMMGRAGRGDTPGEATVLVDDRYPGSIDDLASGITNEVLPEFRSSFEQPQVAGEAWQRQGVDDTEARLKAARTVCAVLLRAGEAGMSPDQLRDHFGHSLGARDLSGRVDDVLGWLADSRRMLVWQDPDTKAAHLTRLGEYATAAVLPPEFAAGFAQLLRDLMLVDVDDKTLLQWDLLDHLIVVDLLSANPKPPDLRRYSAAMVDQVDGWVEGSTTKSVLFAKWIMGSPEVSRADQLLGSLGIALDAKPGKAQQVAHRRCYVAAYRSAVVLEMGNGKPLREIERQWKAKNLTGQQEKWRDNLLLWLLSGLAQILDIKSFYYHLREECRADDDRIRRVKRCLQRMRAQVYKTLELTKYCSPLGPVLYGVRRSTGRRGKPNVGLRTMKRLEEAGVNSIADLASRTADDLCTLGVRRDFARQITAYVRRRML
jgi:helicase